MNAGASVRGTGSIAKDVMSGAVEGLSILSTYVVMVVLLLNGVLVGR